jgi:hypothetical protein
MMTAVEWTIWVEVRRPDGTSDRCAIGTVQRTMSSPGPADLGLRLAETKDLLHRLQLRLVQDQVEQASVLDRPCAGCGSRRALHDHRRRVIDTLFGRVTVRQPRFRVCICRRGKADRSSGNGSGPDRVSALLDARATPELACVQAELGARLSFREAARVLRLLLPSGSAANYTAVRRRLAQTADRLQARDDASPHRMSLAQSGPVVVSIDGAHIRAVPGFQTRHFEVTTGRVEAQGRPPRHFAVAPNVPASRPGTIRNALRAQGWLPGREVLVLSDGDPSLVGAVRSAVREPVTHILDWFHISMRVRHIEQAHAGLLGSDLEHKGSLDYAGFDVERLRNLIWNGYADEARRALPGIMQMAWNAIWLNGQRGRARIERFAQLVKELETYLALNASALVDYGRRYRAGLPISTSRAESVVNSLVNARMNKRRQMRWSPRGAHRVLQVRAAVIDGRLSAGQMRLAA